MLATIRKCFDAKAFLDFGYSENKCLLLQAFIPNAAETEEGVVHSLA